MHTKHVTETSLKLLLKLERQEHRSCVEGWGECKFITKANINKLQPDRSFLRPMPILILGSKNWDFEISANIHTFFAPPIVVIKPLEKYIWWRQEKTWVHWNRKLNWNFNYLKSPHASFCTSCSVKAKSFHIGLYEHLGLHPQYISLMAQYNNISQLIYRSSSNINVIFT